MNERQNLASLYQQAQSALRTRDYNRAADLLKQILVIDENYKDASRLLAEMVKLKRRRWYNDPRIWGVLIGVAAVSLLVLFATTLNWKALLPSPTATRSRTQVPTATPTTTLIPTPTLIPVPLAWKRLYDGSQFERAQVTAIAIDPRDLDIIYAGTDGAGIYKTIDGGISWKPSFAGLGQASLKSLVVNPANPNMLYAITVDGLYMSNDGATSWQAILLGIGSGILIDPNNSEHLYYIQHQDVSESFDEGQTWFEVKTSLCPNEIGYPVIHPRDGQTIFASQGNGNTDCLAGVYVSHDAGSTWEYLGLEYGYLSLSVSLDDQGDVIIYAAQSGGNAKIYRTRDGGQNWEDAFPALSLCGGSLWANPVDVHVAYYWSMCGPTGLWATINAGQSWQEVMPLHLIPVRTFAISQDGSRLVAGGEGVYISMDGGKTWDKRNDGMGAARLYLEQDITDPAILYVRIGCRAGESCNFYRSADGGRTWSEVTLEGSPLSCIDVSADGILYAYSAIRGSMWLSRDGGRNWQQLTVPWRVNEIFTHPDLPGCIVVFVDGPPYIWVTTDAGQTWLAANIDKVDRWSILFTPNSMDQIYLLGSYHQVYHSQDGGITWVPLEETIWNNRSESWRVFDPRDSRRAISLGTEKGIFSTANEKNTWMEQNQGLGNLSVNSLALYPQNPDIVYAGTDGGAYISFNFGNTWGKVNDGLLGATVVYSIVVTKDSNVYAATPYGIFKLEGK